MFYDGLVKFGQNILIVFIKDNDILLYFFEYLGCIIQKVIEIYINYILLKFIYMFVKVILQYLKFIKDIILFNLKYNLNKENC